MPMKEKSVSKKAIFEYDSPDGDNWEIIFDFADFGDNDRKYVQYRQIMPGDSGEKKLPNTIDGDMLLAMADAYRKFISGSKADLSNGVKNIFGPNIVDHRVVTQGDHIQQQVDTSMKNRDDSIVPLQSLSPQSDKAAVNYDQFRTGVDPSIAAEPPGETPDSWKLNNPPGDLSGWQKDVINRKAKTASTDRPDVKKISAKDII